MTARNVAMNLEVGEPPDVQDTVAIAFEKADQERSQYLDQRCRALFARERVAESRLAVIRAKQKATREANKAIRLARGEER